MKLYGKTDVGKIRQTNQDSFQIVHIDDLWLGVVCDGMGGAAGGSTASATACRKFVYETALRLNECGGDKTRYEEILCAALDAANAEVYGLSLADESLSGMGTTLCAALTDGKRLWALSVGDSRIYLFRDGEIMQLSHDHSYVQALVDSGTITPAESRVHPQKNIITRAVGTQESVECDSFVMDFHMDGLLLCSDGLTNYVSDDELNRRFWQNTTLEQLADVYIDAANHAGGGDNITVLLLKQER